MNALPLFWVNKSNQNYMNCSILRNQCFYVVRFTQQWHATKTFVNSTYNSITLLLKLFQLVPLKRSKKAKLLAIKIACNQTTVFIKFTSNEHSVPTCAITREDHHE